MISNPIYIAPITLSHPLVGVETWMKMLIIFPLNVLYMYTIELFYIIRSLNILQFRLKKYCPVTRFSHTKIMFIFFFLLYKGISKLLIINAFKSQIVGFSLKISSFVCFLLLKDNNFLLFHFLPFFFILNISTLMPLLYRHYDILLTISKFVGKGTNSIV